MQFGKHLPAESKDKGPQSPMATFTRGLQLSGHQWKFAFPNGYGASVIDDGYGAENGLYEVGVLHNGHLTYETPITDDVLGFLTERQVIDTLDQIEALTPESVLEGQIAREIEKRDVTVAACDQRIADLRVELEALTAGVSR